MSFALVGDRKGIWPQSFCINYPSIPQSPLSSPPSPLLSEKEMVDAWRERESQCWSNASQHILIYLQTFTSYSEILVRNCNFFPPPCIGGVPIGIPGKSLDLRKLESWGYQAVKSEDSLMTG